MLNQELQEQINSTEVTNYNSYTELLSYMPEHKAMVAVIQENLPEIQRATSMFGKSQSQFMDNLLTVSHPTPIRNARQILAEVTKSKQALQEAYFNCRKKEIDIKMKVREMESTKDDLRLEMLEVEAMELRSQLETTKTYVSGAIRKVAAYMEQYNSILESHGLKEFTEADFEKEEERYHIMKAFEQGLTAARSRNGLIDEGNLIYFSQIGVNGAAAQMRVMEYLKVEADLFKNGKEPTQMMQVQFLNNMADVYSGTSKVIAKSKGMTGDVSKVALIEKGDTRLLEER